jgi:hypothetical protein
MLPILFHAGVSGWTRGRHGRRCHLIRSPGSLILDVRALPGKTSDDSWLGNALTDPAKGKNRPPGPEERRGRRDLFPIIAQEILREDGRAEKLKRGADEALGDGWIGNRYSGQALPCFRPAVHSIQLGRFISVAQAGGRPRHCGHVANVQNYIEVKLESDRRSRLPHEAPRSSS